MGRYAQGRALVNLLQLEEGETVQNVLHLRDLEDERALFFVTRQGRVKRTLLSEYQNIHRGGIIAVELREGDELIATRLVARRRGGRPADGAGPGDPVLRRPGADHGSHGERREGHLAEGGRPRGRRGPRATRRPPCSPSASAATPSGRRFARVPARRRRGGQGVRNLSQAGLERNGPVVAARTVRDGDEIILITERGQTIRMQVTEDQFRAMGRSTGGVKAIEVPEGDRLISMAWVRPEADEEDLADDDGPAGDEDPAETARSRRTRA